VRADDVLATCIRQFESAEFVARAAIRAMLRGKRTVVPGLFNKLSCLSVRFVTRRFASRVATQVLGKPRLALPARREA
jgi:short-subunit dehydrogenase